MALIIIILISFNEFIVFRYQKCLKAGMKESWVLSEEQKKFRLERKKNKAINIKLGKQITNLDTENEKKENHFYISNFQTAYITISLQC